MTPNEDLVRKSLLLLHEQREALGELRNANPRDPSFKQWRQNTLTALQRIWPGDAARTDRFRRIVFTPNASRPDPKLARETYERGWNEASDFFLRLVQEIELRGVPSAPAEGPRFADDHGEHEDHFTTLDLSASPSASPDALGIPSHEDIVLDLGGPVSGQDPALAVQGRDPDAPEPPKLKVAPKSNAKRGGAVRKTAGRKAVVKTKLKDLLGLEALEAAEPIAAPRPEPAAPSSPAAEARTDRRSASSPRAPDRAAGEAPNEPSIASAPDARVSIEHRESQRTVSIESLISAEFRNAPPIGSSDAAAAGRALAGAHAAPATPAETGDVAAMAPTSSPNTVADAAPVAAPVDEPEAGPEDVETVDPGQFAAAAAEFFKHSPVMSSQARPVQRRAESPDFTEADALAIASLSEDVGRLGVPPERRAAMRAQLMRAAAELESGDLTWSTLRETVAYAMAHPPVARRLMPILLPWFEQAA